MSNIRFSNYTKGLESDPSNDAPDFALVVCQKITLEKKNFTSLIIRYVVREAYIYIMIV